MSTPAAEAQERFARRLKRALALAKKDGICIHCQGTALVLALAEIEKRSTFNRTQMLAHLQQAGLLRLAGILMELETTPPPAGTRH
jgi:hypothetical protein